MKKWLIISLVFLVSIIIVIIYSINKNKYISDFSCTSEYNVVAGKTQLSSSMSITHKNNKGLILLVGDYLKSDGTTIQIRISKPFTYTQSKNTFHSESNSISLIPKEIYQDMDLIHMLPIFLTESNSEVVYSVIPLKNNDYIIQQGITPVLYCINNK